MPHHHIVAFLFALWGYWMPWAVKDVDKHKKGLTPAQKKQWVSIANGILKDCQAKKGKNCEGKAIRIANSKFKETTMIIEKMLQGALWFQDHEAGSIELFIDGDKPPKLKMVAYSGGVIKNHWYWDNLLIDTSGVKFEKPKYPILEDHMTSKKIAFTGKPKIDNHAIVIDPDKTQFLDTEESVEFQKNSQKGFPYEASIYAKPTKIERISEDSFAEANGINLKGPGTIWRECIFKEASVCVFGHDANTKASAFGSPEIELSFEQVISPDKDKHIKKEVTKEMDFDIEKFKKDNPEDYKALMEKLEADVACEIQDKLDRIDGLSEQNKTLTSANETLRTQLTQKDGDNQTLSDRVLVLEKDETLRKENEKANLAETIWNGKLAASDVSGHLHDKCKNQVSYKKFIKDGDLDRAAFEEAIDNEIKDWEDKGVTDSVLGSGFVKKDPTAEENAQKFREKEDDSIVADLYSKSGASQEGGGE